MAGNNALIEDYHAIMRVLEEMRSSDPRFVDYRKNGMTPLQKLMAIEHNESIILNSEEFRNLLTKRRVITMKIMRDITRQAESRMARELNDEYGRDDEIDETYKHSGEDILGRRAYAACPYGFGGMIKRNELKDIICEGPMNEAYCERCKYNPEASEEDDTKT